MVGNLFEIEVEGKNFWICKWDLSVMFNECVWKFKKVLDEILKKKMGKVLVRKVIFVKWWYGNIIIIKEFFFENIYFCFVMLRCENIWGFFCIFYWWILLVGDN